MLLNPLLTHVLLGLAPLAQAPAAPEPAPSPFQLGTAGQWTATRAPAGPSAQTPPSERGMLGLYLGPAEERAVIDGLVSGGPAEQAGLRGGDRVLAIDGEEVQGWRDVGRLVQSRRAGELVRVRVEREGWTREFELHLAPLPESSAPSAEPAPPQPQARPAPRALRVPGMQLRERRAPAAPEAPGAPAPDGGALDRAQPAPPPQPHPGHAKVIIKTIVDGEEQVRELELPLGKLWRMDVPPGAEHEQELDVYVEAIPERIRERVRQRLDGAPPGAAPRLRALELRERAEGPVGGPGAPGAAPARPELDALRAELEGLRRELQELRQSLRRMQAGGAAR